MKKIINIAALAILTLSICVIDACKIKNPTEGFHVIVKADATLAPSNFRVYDVSTNTRLDYTGNIPVTISGKDAAKVFTPGGYQTFSAFEGKLLISLRKGTIVSINNPIEYVININIPGYLPVSYPVTLTNEAPANFEIGMVNVNDLPKGSTVTNATAKTDNSGTTTAPVVIQTTTTPDKAENVNITIPTGTQMKDANGNAVVGDVQASVVQFTPTNMESVNSFPGGQTTKNITDKNGNPLPDGTLSPLGWLDMSMSVGSSEVKTFSKPLDVKMEISPLLTKNDGTAYKEGDVLNVYSKSKGEANWVLEGTSTLVKNTTTGKIEAPMSVNHLSVWTICSFNQECGEYFVFNINNLGIYPIKGVISFLKPDPTNVLIPGGSVEGRFDFEYDGLDLYVDNGKAPYAPGDATFRTCNGQKYFVLMQLEGMSTNKIVGPMELCGQTPPVFNLPTTLSQNYNFEVDISCKNGNKVLIPKGTQVYYIDNAVYNNTIVGTGKAAHKVDPSDNLANTWNMAIIDIQTIDRIESNIISIPQNVLSEGKNYRFSVYYDVNASNTGSRNDKVFPDMGVGKQEADPTGISGPKLTQLDIDGFLNHLNYVPVQLTTCPF